MSIDPIALATVTSALVVMSQEIAKGGLSEAGKNVWKTIAARMGWEHQVPVAKDLAPDAAAQLNNDRELARDVIALLKSAPTSASAGLVGRIVADKVVVASSIQVDGDFNM